MICKIIKISCYNGRNLARWATFIFHIVFINHRIFSLMLLMLYKLNELFIKLLKGLCLLPRRVAPSAQKLGDCGEEFTIRSIRFPALKFPNQIMPGTGAPQSPGY